MRLITKRRIVFLSIVSITLVILIAAWALGLWRIYSSSTKYRDLAMKAAQEAADLDQSRKLVGVIKDAETYYVDLSHRAIPKEGIVPFIETLEKLGSRSGANVSLGSINAPDDSSEVTSAANIKSLDDSIEFGHVSLNVSAVGEWVNIMKLLKITENLPYALHIDKVRISKSASGSTILVDNSSSGDAIPIKLGTTAAGKSSLATKITKPVELWSLQFELTVLKII